MEIKRSGKTVVELTKASDMSVYLHSWGAKVDLDFSETDAEGVRQEIEISVPLESARLIAEELKAMIAKHDEKEAAKKAEAEAEAAAEAEAEAATLEVAAEN